MNTCSGPPSGEVELDVDVQTLLLTEIDIFLERFLVVQPRTMLPRRWPFRIPSNLNGVKKGVADTRDHFTVVFASLTTNSESVPEPVQRQKTQIPPVLRSSVVQLIPSKCILCNRLFSLTACEPRPPTIF